MRERLSQFPVLLIVVFDFFDVFHLFEAGIENVVALIDTATI